MLGTLILFYVTFYLYKCIPQFHALERNHTISISGNSPYTEIPQLHDVTSSSLHVCVHMFFTFSEFNKCLIANLYIKGLYEGDEQV